MSRSGKIWMIGGAFIAVVIMAIGWFALAAPQLDQAADADAARAEIEAQNEVERAILEEMKQQYESLDELLDDLEELQLSVPGTRDLEDFYDEIAAAANLAGVVLNGVTVEPALPYAAAVAEGGGAEPAPAADEAADEATGSVVASLNGMDGIAAPVLPSPGLQSNLYVLPISLKITADLNQASTFLALLQRSEHGRLILVNGVSMTIGSTLSGELTGFIFVVHDPSTGSVGSLPEPEPEETPVPEVTATPSPTPTVGFTPTPTPTP
ncbi:hypothetical protein [Pseudolysinimonas yzui]|uniref:Type 4a pilus biogenesis protein PilO n=1 Tax=Pseudolysinimonas yzui TaxID=2708254 RepID=A0A8J3GRY5_9MICO|nr:hypothetical protein [Pseudolysinimonas yzui]GHF20908.1 hypothetical protein GCM10011600_22430 [Pseudolysinimonas yzui]